MRMFHKHAKRRHIHVPNDKAWAKIPNKSPKLGPLDSYVVGLVSVNSERNH